MSEASISARSPGSGAETPRLDNTPVPPDKLQPAGYFAGNYAGEHVAGTEFVIGALFVGAGAAASDVLLGLLLGNLLAVLTWVFVTTPIAVDTRLTLYAYLEKIAGRHFIRLYSIVNGIMFLGLAGSMITVSASAVRVLYNSVWSGAPIAAQTGYFPTDIRFILIALAVGGVVVTIAVMGFRRLAQFAGAVVPWMICMFLVGALALYPMLASANGGALPATSIREVWTVLSTQVYQPTPMEGAFWAIPNEAKSFWSIAAFAWVANLAMHGSLGDMTLLRFAKRRSYGWFSALGMFIGHFACWVFAGVMGAGAAYALKANISDLDPGAVATSALGGAGVIAVIIAGWTTSNPTLYRAGLAFQSLNPKWNRAWVTFIVGLVTMILACSPFVFSQLLGYVGWMGLTLSPVGAVIVAEHWLFKPLGLNRYWNSYRKSGLNLAAVIAWAAAFAVIFGLYFGAGVHQFFLLVPAWITSTIVYLASAKALGAGAAYPAADVEEAEIAARQKREADYLSAIGKAHQPPRSPILWKVLQCISYLSLAWIVVSATRLVLADGATYSGLLDAFRANLIWPTLIFFSCAAARVISSGK